MFASFSRATLSIAAGVIASTFVAAVPATAQDYPVIIRGVPPDTKMRVVSYRDLNLNYAAHRRILIDRVNRAVHDVCDFSVRDAIDTSYRACADASWSGAWPQINRAYAQAAQFAYNGYRRR